MDHTIEAGLPPFDSMHAALMFAFHHSSQTYARPTMNRMASPAPASGHGLGGLDGAAQAGMIRAEVAALGRLAEAIIIARIAPHGTPCHCGSPCCSGRRPNREWIDAIAWLADHIRRTALNGCTANAVLRHEYVRRHFTRKADRVSIDALASRHGLNRNTISSHTGKVSEYFGGRKRGDAGVEAQTMDAIDTRLCDIGIVTISSASSAMA